MKHPQKKYFYSLNIKLMLVVLLAILSSLVVFWSMCKLEDYVADKVYLSDYAKKKALDSKYDKFNRYVKEMNVKGTDKKKLSAWLKKEKYTRLFVWDNNRDVFSGGWSANSETTQGVLRDSVSLEENKEEIVLKEKNTKNRIGSDSFKEDIYNRYVWFADGKYYTYINVNGEQYWYNIMDVATVIMTVFAFLFVIMFYNTMVIGRIKRFSNEVVNISSGNLQSEIRVDSRDEIGRLAMSVDNMRNSLLETMNNEKAAWAANTALITAMSHDVRTPLTSLIGYLDIIEGKKFRTEEDLIRYIHSCREKAFQLKDLSDELFSYFLVFGNPGNAELEEVDAGILFQQLLGEHVAEVLNYGRNITLTYDIPEDVWVKVNVSSLRRLFDNLFSNILKYAGKDFPVEVCATYSENRIEILFRNTIWKEAKQRESTKIGVKTCRKICEDMYGTFSAIEEGESYVTHITFPVPRSKEGGGEKDDADAGARNS